MYPNGVAHDEVKQYLQAYYGQQYKHKRNGNEQVVISRPKVEPGRHILTRVLADGAWTIQRTGAGKVCGDVLDDILP